MDIKQSAAGRLAIIKADELVKVTNESAVRSAALIAEFLHWANADPLGANLDLGSLARSGFADLQRKVFKILRTPVYDFRLAIQDIVIAARVAGYKVFGDDDEYLPYVIIGYEDDDINRVINTESIQPSMIDPVDLFQKIAKRVPDEVNQAITLFAAQALKMLNGGVCNQLHIVIPPESAALFLARYQPVLEAYGFTLIHMIDGYKILFKNPGNYDMPCQLIFSDSVKAVSLMRGDKVGIN